MNTGVQIQKKATDWVAGSDTGVAYKEVTNDWSPFLPVAETQEPGHFETQSCVTFSALNAIEMQLRQQGIDINLSDRFTAKMSGTTQSGNSAQNVLYSIAHDGWLLEEDWPYPTNVDANNYWATFFAEIPQALKDKAKQNLANATWEIQYDWVNLENCQPDLNVVKTYLEQCPLQMISSYSSGLCATEHARVVYKIDSVIHTMDSVAGLNDRQLPLNYPMPYLIRIAVVPKTPLVTIIPPITHDLRYGATNDQEVKYLQQKLIKLGYLSKGLDTGNYMNLTQQAVYKFQVDYKVANPLILLWNQGRFVYSFTRNALNKL